MTTRSAASFWRFPTIALAGVLAVGAATSTTTSIPSALIGGLKWRNVGPFRAGRVSAVSGAIGQPGVFYMGMVLGGVWKTTSAGTTWYPVFDSIKDVSSIGSIEVAPSDPNVVYVGTGSTGDGNGIYKSTDAGKTWRHLPGFEDSGQIPAILVDPHNPNLLLVSVLGSTRATSDRRGIYRSTDGGETWTKTLAVDANTGTQSLAWAYDHPNVVLASTIQRASRGTGSAATATAPAATAGTGLYKSTDQGQTWKAITGGGLPTALTGRLTVAVAMNTNAQRMFVAALHRSASFARTTAERRGIAARPATRASPTDREATPPAFSSTPRTPTSSTPSTPRRSSLAMAAIRSRASKVRLAATIPRWDGSTPPTTSG